MLYSIHFLYRILLVCYRGYVQEKDIPISTSWHIRASRLSFLIVVLRSLLDGNKFKLTWQLKGVLTIPEWQSQALVQQLLRDSPNIASE